MKRRDFLSYSTASAGLLVPAWVNAATPCKPPTVAVVGGTSITSNCSSPSALSDWTARSTGPGVVTAIRFDKQANVTNYIHHDSTAADVQWNSTGGIIGDGCMHIAVPKSAGSASGAWRAPLSPAWTQPSDGFGATPFYVQFRCKLGLNRLIPSVGGGGFKFMLLGGYIPSSPDSSSAFSSNCIVWTNDNWYGIPWGYRYVNSAEGFVTALAGGDNNLQPALSCLYSNVRNGNTAGCWAYVEEQWFTMLMQVQIPNYGTGVGTGNVLNVWLARQGATTWTQTHNMTNFLINSDPTYSSGPNGLWLLPYDTGRTSSSVDTYHEYDQVIVSTQPIACPLV